MYEEQDGAQQYREKGGRKSPDDFNHLERDGNHRAGKSSFLTHMKFSAPSQVCQWGICRQPRAWSTVLW